MNKKFLLPAFAVMVLIQLFIPAKMIFDKEQVLNTGDLFKFRTAPVDPNDPFRGKYVALNFADNIFQYSKEEDWYNTDLVYVTLSTDSAGFAIIKNVTKHIPENETYFTAFVQSVLPYEKQLVIQYPFDRFYVEESKAPEIEEKYLEAFRDSSRVAYALVAVRDGDAVLKDLILD
jgi:uncharacterized membrane-anchored protein